MNNTESLYQGFKKYFNVDREEINYFLEVLKTIKEDKWEYDYSCLNFKFDKKETKTLKYDNIKIIYIIKTYYDYIDYHTDFDEEVEVLVNNTKIFKSDDESDELFYWNTYYDKASREKDKGEMICDQDMKL